MKILPYRNPSESAKLLARNLRAIYMSAKKRPIGSDTVINWGNTKLNPSGLRCRIINNPTSVRTAVNKHLAFLKMLESQISIPEFTTDYNVAKEWVEDGGTVIVRNILNGHSGQGIIVVQNVDDLPRNSPLYVKYFNGKNEFRVHVFNGQVIDYIQKKQRSGMEEGADKFVRSYEKGWVFCRSDIIHSDLVKQEAIKAVRSLGLDFGAVDIRANGDCTKVKVLEVNTAPALSGTTLTNYVNAIRNAGYFSRR